jgi:hypothetical protein
MRGSMTGLAMRQWAFGVLDEIAGGRSDLDAKQHPLGFVCLPIERRGHRGACVHVWSDSLPRATPTTSIVHAHSWDLISYVLYGSVCNTVFHVTDTARQAAYRVFEVRSDGEVDELCATSRLVRCEIATVKVNYEGDDYALPAGIFHASVIRGEAATVALGNRRPGMTDLSLGEINTRSHQLKRQSCNRDETTAVARMVVQRLAAQEEPWRP